MKICVIGNSHMAALKLAIRQGVYVNRENAFTFWGTPGDSFNEITYANRQFSTPHTPVVLEVSDSHYVTLPIDDFDALVFHGNELHPWIIMQSLRMNSPDLRSYSVQFLSAGLDGHLNTIHAINLASVASQDFAGPIIVSPTPLINDESGFFDGMEFHEDEYPYLCSILNGLLQNRSLLFMPQPVRTIIQGKYTPAEYSRGSVELVGDLERKINDQVHMNSLYGKSVLDALTDLLARETANENGGGKVCHEGARGSAIAHSDEGRASRRQRKNVEMPFAYLKRILKLDRLRLRGPNGAHDELPPCSYRPETSEN